jgi:RNA polymerase sigma factor (sigma-70 family)
MEPLPEIVRHNDAAASPQLHGLPRPSVDPQAAAELHAAIDRGDGARALTLIDALFGDALFRFIYAMVRSQDRADDVYQTTLLEVFRDLPTLRARDTLRPWLFSVARHRCLDALKVARRRDARFVPVDELPAAARAEAGAGADAGIDAGSDAQQQLTAAQLVAALDQCLDQLAAEVRMVLMMRFAEGFSYEEIARVSRVGVEAARARVSRALPVLRRCIERTGAV